MVDVAELGFKIDARQVQGGVKELRELERAGQRAGAMADHLSGKTAGATRQIRDMERAAGQASRMLGNMFGLSIAGSLTTFLYGLSRAKDQILELAKVAEDNRLRPELVSGLLGAARGAGASEPEIIKALRQFSDVSKQTKDDAETFYKAMSNVSPSLARAFQNAGSQEERLRLISDAIRNTTDEVKRLQLAYEAFGTDSERVLRVLGMGRDALSEYERNARALGMAVDQGMIQKARQADQVLAQLSNVVQSNLRAALVELAPIIGNFASQLGSMADAASRVVSAIAGAQYATRNVLLERRTGFALQINREQAEIDRLRAQSGGTFVEGTDAARQAVAAERRRMDAATGLRDVETELGARGEYLDPRDRRRRASEQFAQTGGLNPNPPAFRPRADLSSSGDDEKEDSFTRAKRSLEERNAMAQKELETLGLGLRAREEALAYERALNVAKRDGETLSADQLRQLRERAATYGMIQEAIEKANDAQRKANELQDAGRDALKGILLAPTQKNPIDALISSMDRFRQKLLDMAADELLDAVLGRRGKNGPTSGGMLGGGGVGSIFGELFGKLFNFFPAMAEGGEVRGPGNGTSDSILTWLSNGEHVTNAKSASKYRPLLDAINADAIPRMAAGGRVNDGLRLPQRPTFGAAGLGNVIINNNGEPVSGRASRDENGNTVIDLDAMKESVSGQVASDITRGRGSVGKAISSRFGLPENGNLIG